MKMDGKDTHPLVPCDVEREVILSDNTRVWVYRNGDKEIVQGLPDYSHKWWDDAKRVRLSVAECNAMRASF